MLKSNDAWTIFASKPYLPTIAVGPMRSAGERRSGRSSKGRYIVETAIAAACAVTKVLSYTSITGGMKPTQRKVTCGPGYDTVDADYEDKVGSSCEDVWRY